MPSKPCIVIVKPNTTDKADLKQCRSAIEQLTRGQSAPEVIAALIVRLAVLDPQAARSELDDALPGDAELLVLPLGTGSEAGGMNVLAAWLRRAGLSPSNQT